MTEQSPIDAEHVSKCLRLVVKGIMAAKGHLNQNWALDYLAHKSGWNVETLKHYLHGKGSLRRAKDKEKVIALARVVADAGVKIAWLNQEWLREWLLATAYPEPDTLIRQYFPLTEKRTILGVKHDFGRYSEGKVERAQAHEIVRAFQRSMYVILYGPPGIGKSVLANQVGRIWVEHQAKKAEAVWGMWCSDRDKGGSLNLYGLLVKIAKYANYIGYGAYSEEELREEVTKLLCGGNWFIVIDHAQTITDPTLFAWLEEITALGVRVLVTKLERQDNDEEVGKPIRAKPMEPAEAAEFIIHALQLRELHINDSSALENLAAALDYHPRHLLNAIGYIAGSKDKTIEQSLKDVLAEPEQFTKDRWLRASWEALGKYEQHFLGALSLFDTRVGFSAACMTAGLRLEDGQAVIDELSARALIEEWRPTAQDIPRYGLTPLIRKQVFRFLRNDMPFLAAARERQVRWCVDLVDQCLKQFWEDLYAFRALDAEHSILDNIIKWCSQNEHWQSALAIAKVLGYYYFLRGHWDLLREVDRVRLSAAAAVSPQEEALAYAFYVQVLAKQRRLAEIEQPHMKMAYLQATCLKPEDESHFQCSHATALWFIAKGQWQEASDKYRHCLRDASDSKAPAAIGRYWLARVLSLQKKYDEALDMAQQAYETACRLKVQQTIVDSQVLLADIYLAHGNSDEARKHLDESLILATSLQLVSVRAEIKRAFGRYFTQLRQWAKAVDAFVEAADLFKRLGLDHEVNEIEQEKKRLMEGE